MPRSSLLALVVLLACASSASAAPLKLRDTGLRGTLARSDGGELLAISADGRAATILDVRTKARRTIQAPAPTCRFTAIHHATLLWSCDNPAPALDSGVTYDLATGASGALPQPQPIRNSGPDSGTYAAIGDQWARANFAAFRPLSAAAFVLRDGGRQLLLDPVAGVGRDSIVDLDSPTLTRKLCAGMRRPQVSDAYGYSDEDGGLAIAGRRAATTTYPPRSPGRVELQRCGAKPRTLKVCGDVSCSQPVIDDRIVAWVQTRRHKAQLVVRSLQTGRTRTTSMRGETLTPVLAGDRLYVLARDQLLAVAL